MRKRTLTLIALVSFSVNAQGNKHTQKVTDNLVMNMSGYTQVKVDTDLQQKYPLLKITSLNFPSSIKYIGQSLNYVLSLSGYSLENLKDTNYETLNLYSLRLPLTNRSFQRSTTLQIVETIIGAGFEISVKEESRIIKISPVN